MLACYLKSGFSTSWQSLKIGRTVTIRSGDVVSLLPDESWFKIISNDSNAMEDDDFNGKRKATNSSEEEPPDKKLRSDGSMETIYSQSKSVLNDSDPEGTVAEEPDNCIVNCADTNDISDDSSGHRVINSVSSPNGNPSVEVISIDSDNGNNVAAIAASTSVENTNNSPTDSPDSKDTIANRNRDESGKKIKWDCGQHFSDQTDQRSNETTKESGEASATSEGNPTANAEPPATSDEPPPRNKCTYGSTCYRRNADHRAVFSHPGDSDYDIPDDRPECPYGVRCYRKNPQHKRDFKHTKNRRTRAQTPVRARTPNATSGTEQSSADESVDESEYEPSLVTSDDYESDFDRSDYDGVSDLDDK